MKKKSFFILIISFFTLITLLTLSQKGKKANTVVTIAGETFKLQVADNDSERKGGLSLTKYLPHDEGMLFIFGDRNIREFWMKDTLIPLQIIFIDGCNIVDIQEMAVEKNPSEPEKIYKSQFPADKAIELGSHTISENIIGERISELCNPQPEMLAFLCILL